MTRSRTPSPSVSARSNSAITSCSLVVSIATPVARPPALRIAATSASTFSGVRPATKTCRPSRASRSHRAPPSPARGPTPTTMAFVSMVTFSSDPDRHALQLRVVMQGLQALLASDAALLVAAEGGLDAARHPLVHVDLPRLEPGGHAVGAGQVARPDAGGEAVRRVVRGTDCLVLVGEGHHGHDRAEDLLARDAHVVPYPGIDGRQDEPTPRERRVVRQRTGRRRGG